MSIFERISVNLSDTAKFGPQFLLRHLPRLTGAEAVIVRLPGKQHIFLRAGESDVAAVRQTFGSHQYTVEFNCQCADRVRRRYQEITFAGHVPIIVDAGANIGAASLWFARHYPQANIFAIEPEPSNFSVLQKNAALAPNINAIHAAIGSKAGFVKVTTPGLGWTAQTERTNEGVPIITMAEVFAQGVPFIAKIDIEGFESDLFSTNTEWLSKTYVVFLEPHDWLLPGQCTSRTFQAALGREDYEIYISGELLTYIRR
jgi:FkbM family methyltransferase